MKNKILILLLLSIYSVAAQPARTKEQSERLEAKNGFRKYIFGSALNSYTNKIEKRIENAKVHSKLYKFRNEDLNISSSIKAEWIIFEFRTEKLDAVSIKIASGSKQLHDFLFREYGDPDVKPGDANVNIQFYEWKGRQAIVQLYYSEGKEGATFNVTKNDPKNGDSDIRLGF